MTWVQEIKKVNEYCITIQIHVHYGKSNKKCFFKVSEDIRGLSMFTLDSTGYLCNFT